MSVLFDFYISPNPSGEDMNNPRYHARVVNYHTASTNEIIDEIHRRSSLTPGDVKAALSELSQVMARRLANGERVHLEGLGYFQVTLQTNREVDIKKTRSQSVFFKSVKYRADRSLRNQLIGVNTERSRFKKHSKKLTEAEIDKLLTRHFSEKSILFRRDLQYLCGFTEITATRIIRKLRDEGKIRNMNTRYHPIYVPAPGYYGVPEE